MSKHCTIRGSLVRVLSWTGKNSIWCLLLLEKLLVKGQKRSEVVTVYGLHVEKGSEMSGLLLLT